jgi:hypothetical protein
MTLNVNSLGAKPIKKNDGIADPDAVVAGQMYPLWYDGTVFRVLSASSEGGGTASLTGTYSAIPTCNGSLKDTVYYFTDSGWYDKAICNGSSWTYYHRGNALTRPAIASYNAIGTATTSDATGPIRIVAGVGGRGFNGLSKPIISGTERRITALIHINYPRLTSPECGIFVGTSGAGSSKDWTLLAPTAQGTASSSLEVTSFDETTGVGPFAQMQNGAFGTQKAHIDNGFVWLRITLTATSYTAEYSQGGDWTTVISQTYAGMSFTNPQTYGLSCAVNGATGTVSGIMHVLHVAEEVIVP